MNDFANEVYASNKWLVIERVNSFHVTTGHDVSDLLSEANNAFVKALNSYDGSIKFSSWLYKNVNNALKTFVTRKQRPMSIEGVMENTPETRCFDRPDCLLMFKDKLNSLSGDARFVADIVIKGAEEVTGAVCLNTPTRVRSGIKKYLKTLGWSRGACAKAFLEVSEAFGGRQ